jgi:hypothetical protein
VVLADTEIERELVVVAHPDDADFWAGGTIAGSTSRASGGYCQPGRRSLGRASRLGDRIGEQTAVDGVRQPPLQFPESSWLGCGS